MRILAHSVFVLAVGAAACTADHRTAPGQDATDAPGGDSTTSGQDATTDAPGDGLDPEIAAMRDGIAERRISTTIARLVAFGTRSACTPGGGDPTQGIDAARDWIRDQLAAIPGLTMVTLDPYVQACQTPFTRNNVVAWIAGAHPERLIVIGGHYDSRTLDVTDGTSPAPGANDSGSQTSVVLEAARAMAGRSFDATVVFVAFAGEEQALQGSAAFARRYQTYFPGATIEAMLNCDIVGGDNTTNDAAALQQFRIYSPGTPRELGSAADGSTDDTSPSRGLMRSIGTWGSAYVPAMEMLPKLREDRVGRGGDQQSFIARGYPGVRFIEPVESFAHQHNANDLVAFVTPGYTARVAQVVVSVAAVLARAPRPPQAMTASGGSTAGVTLAWTPAAGIDHFVVAARAVTENRYRTRLRAPGSASGAAVRAADLGVAGEPAFFVSVAAVDAKGHESLFAYPELRCDDAGCVAPPDANDPTAIAR